MGQDLGQVFNSLGWALLHSLWQGALAMLAVLVFRALTKSSSPSLRYNFQFLCLVLCFAAFLVTFGLYQIRGEAAAGLINSAAAGGTSPQTIFFAAAPEALQNTTTQFSLSAAAYAPLIGLLWCLGFLFVAMRYLAAYVLTQKLRNTGLNDVSVFWQNRFRTLVLNTGVSDKVRLFVSDHVTGPLTIGFLRPVVLVPAGFLMGLPRDQVEAILLHELAHIRRYDYLINLFQTAIKTVFFYHPAIHYISKKIDNDREQACDDLAVAQTRDPQALVRGLAALQLDMTGRGFALSADGGDTPLMERLKRLVGSVEYQRRPEHLIMPLIMTFLIGGIYLSTTAVADAHPEKSDSYEHADASKHNYHFETARLNGKSVTLKITEDGRRWVLADGAWVDVDKSPEVLKRLRTEIPQPPQPPEPPKAAKYFNGTDFNNGFDTKMNQFEIDMEYFEADLERYLEENNHLSENELERIEETAERAAEKAEREAERLEDRMEDSRDRAERQAERAQEQRERAQEQRERAQEQRERAQERAQAARERAQERSAEARERAEEARERARERSQEARDRADEKHAKYNDMRETLYGYLIDDGLISSRNDTVKMRYDDGHWVANGTRVPAKGEGKYCELFSEMGIKKSSITKVEIKPGSTQIVSQSKAGKNNHSVHITHGKFEHEDVKSKKAQKSDKHLRKHKHKDGSIHDPDAEPIPSPKPQSINFETSTEAPEFVPPTKNIKINAAYGLKSKLWPQSHQGIDLSGKTGDLVYASADGLVELITTEPKWGNRIILKHAAGYQTLYGHLEGFAVKRGDVVKAGDVIALVGSTGKSTGPHLHFEIRKDGKTLDPSKLIS